MSTHEKISNNRIVIEVVTRLTPPGSSDSHALYNQFLRVITPLVGGKKHVHELIAYLVKQKVVRLISQERLQSKHGSDGDKVTENVTIETPGAFDFSEAENLFDLQGRRIQFYDNGRGIDERIHKSVTIQKICVLQ